MNRIIKYAPLMLMFLLSLKAIGQVVPKETIIDEVYNKFIDSTFSGYYLMEDCPKLNLSKSEEAEIRRVLNGPIAPSYLQYMIAKSYSDTLPLKWNQPALAEIIKCLGPLEASGILGRQFSDTSKLSKKDMEDQKKIWAALPRMKKTVYTFSRPIFNQKGTCALIRLGWQEGAITPTGWSITSKTCICLLESIKGHWRFIQKISCVE